jgi:chromosome segregation ATPase
VDAERRLADAQASMHSLERRLRDADSGLVEAQQRARDLERQRHDLEAALQQVGCKWQLALRLMHGC